MIAGFGKHGDESLFRYLETVGNTSLASMHGTEDKIQHVYTKDTYKKVAHAPLTHN